METYNARRWTKFRKFRNLELSPKDNTERSDKEECYENSFKQSAKYVIYSIYLLARQLEFILIPVFFLLLLLALYFVIYLFLCYLFIFI